MQRFSWIGATVVLALIFGAILAVTAPATGYTRDEGYYFKAGQQYAGWWDTVFSARFFDSASSAEIDRRFSYNHEHPALTKLLQGTAHRIFHKAWGLTGEAQGFRTVGFAFAMLTVLATFLLGRRLFGAPVGFAAAGLVTAQPRFFYDAHLACFDVPITAMWTLTLWAFHRAFEAPAESVRRRARVAGVIFGLALSTKLNALFLPFIFVGVWWIRDGLRFSVDRPAQGGIDLQLPPLPRGLMTILLLGPLVFVATWPWLWHDTVARIGEYLAFHMNHEHYPIMYFGQVLLKPPFPLAFPWVMTAFTVPLPILMLMAIGGVYGIYRVARYRSVPDALLVFAGLLPIVLISLPTTPIFGGVKHWYNALPCLSILGAKALWDAVGILGRTWDWREPRLRGAFLGTSVAAALAGWLGIAHSHPYGIGFYNELAGGFRGGAALGMQRSFWGGVNRPLMEDLSKLSSGRVFFDHTNYDAYRMYQREGTLPGGIGFANGPEGATAATLFEHREGYPPTVSAAWSSVGPRPVGGVYVDGVTWVELYVKGASSRPPPR